MLVVLLSDNYMLMKQISQAGLRSLTVILPMDLCVVFFFQTKSQ